MSSLKDDFKVNDIKNKISQLQTRIIELKKDSNMTDFDIENKLCDENPEFYDEYPFLIKKLVSGGDISFLYKMLEVLNKVQSGTKSFASAELDLGKKLADDYLYPTVKKENERLNKKK
jgi:hypothetical protein